MPNNGTPPSKTSISPLLGVLVTMAVLLTLFFILGAIYRHKKTRRTFPQFIWSLRGSYTDFCFIRPLQKGGKINIENLYAESECTVKGKNITTKELRANSNIFTSQWVVFIAEHGFGRTTLLKKILQEWIKKNNCSRAMVYIPLKEANENDILSQIIVGAKGQAFSFTAEDIEKLLKTEEFVIILDGFEDLEDSEGSDDQNVIFDNHVTIGDILKGHTIRTYPRLHVWVSTCEEKSKKLPTLSDKMEIKMTGFSKEQVSMYMRLCCQYYYGQVEKKGNFPGKNDASEMCGEYFKQIERFFEDNKITTEFKETPLLVNLMLHILAGNYTGAVPYLKDKTIKDMKSLMYFVIDSMEARHIHKKALPENTSFSDLKTRLGHFASKHDAQTSMGKLLWEENVGKEEVATALEIGLLKYSRGTDSKSKNALVEFYHLEIGKHLCRNALYGTEFY